MSAMLSFLPFLVERAEMLKYAIQRLQDHEKLPTTEPQERATYNISVIIMDGQEWHKGATAPRIADFLRPQAGKTGGP